MLAIVWLLARCTTTVAPQDAAAVAGPADTITYATEAKEIGSVLRDLGSVLSINVALMNGVQRREVGPYDFRNAPYETVLSRLAADGGLERLSSGTYELLAPGDYRRLNQLDLHEVLPGTFTLPAGSVAIGADTPLFDALALVSRAFNTTVIADNAVAAARSGELAMPDIDGVDAIEALLKSARIDDAAFRVVTGENWLLIHAAGNAPRTDVIANRNDLTQAQRTMLTRRVSLRLPQAGAAATEVGAYASASTLENVLPGLSSQLGLTVTADPQLRRFPVNPCVMTNVTVETALRLLINQWLAQAFVVDVNQESLHIRPVE